MMCDRPEYEPATLVRLSYDERKLDRVSLQPSSRTSANMPHVVTAATNFFWPADATAQIVASPGSAPVMHPQRLYLKRKHQINLATVQRPTRFVPRWATATPAAEAFLRRAGPDGKLLSPMVPPDLVSEVDRRRLMAAMARRRRQGTAPTPPSVPRAMPASTTAAAVAVPTAAAAAHHPLDGRGAFAELYPADLRPSDDMDFERGESEDDDGRSAAAWSHADDAAAGNFMPRGYEDAEYDAVPEPSPYWRR
jgi:hypothetical protein